MLPFLKNKERSVGAINTEYRKPDEKPEHEGEMDGHEEALEACASELIRGVESGDKRMVVDALRAAFEILDAMPHEEGEHINEEESEEEEE